MNGMLIFIMVIAGVMLVLHTIRFLTKQDPMDLFTGAFSLLVIFGLYRFTNYLRREDG